jgi:hypothetical protein
VACGASTSTLCAGIESGVDVIDFAAERDARIVSPVNAAASLKHEAVLAGAGDLGINMDSDDKDVRPRRNALARIAPTGAGATGIEADGT